VHDQHERVTVTVHGRPSAILIAPEDLEALEETLAIMRDAATMNRLAESDAELARGEYVAAEELAETMRRRQALWATSPQRISTSCERPPRFAAP
jgi:antitoxin YefM